MEALFSYESENNDGFIQSRQLVKLEMKRASLSRLIIYQETLDSRVILFRSIDGFEYMLIAADKCLMVHLRFEVDRKIRVVA